jgi:two-component system cell cycle sensor histidine kinase/response regulator CckA
MSGHEPGGHLDDAFKLALFGAIAGGLDSYLSCIDRQRRICFLNRTLTRDISTIIGKRMDDFITPPHRDAAIECVERAFASGSQEQVEFTVTLAHGARLHLVTRVVPFRGPGGEALALLVTTDFSEPRRLAAELEQSMEFRRRVVESLPDFVALVDREQRYIWLNRRVSRAASDAGSGGPLEALLAPEGLLRAREAIATAFGSGAVGHFECDGFDAERASASHSVRITPVVSGGNVENVLLIIADITERRRAEEAFRETEAQLERAQRLESLGQLAGGIAHDFNNLLQIIEGNLSFARQSLEEGTAPTEELEQALRATERAAELTSHLLAIGRRQRLDSRRVDLGALVEDSVRMLRRAIPESIALDYQRPPLSHFVALDAPQFEQVLINLCVNARDAMAQGGTLTIRIESEGTSHVALLVADTGTGIARENLGRVFEPFFTTKGTGSGLGLAVAAGIVAAHGGQITVESDGSSGTLFRVRLPRVPAGSEQPAPASERSPGGSGVILVAEDEDLVRAQVERVLRRAGYTVLQANNGARAVELFRSHQAEIELVVLDVVMPELDGWRAYLLMEALKPALKVLFTTGYAANVLPPDFAARGARVLSKPYKPERLLMQVRELLDAAVEPALR